ncbi:hypothetical protein D8770_27655 [Methylobacterium sp. DB1607]|nr:hypothetical protein [Methylobacterium sp. DB1607]
MRSPILLLALLALAGLPAHPATAQGFPGATVGIPLGRPDPFGAMTGRPAEPMNRSTSEPLAGRSADHDAVRPDRRLRSPSRRHLDRGHRAEPKRRPPLARR